MTWWARAMVFALLVACTSSQANPTGAAAESIAPPRGAKSLGVEWRSVHAPSVGTIMLAVSRPVGNGPFPALVILHGSHGFAREYVQLARDLSRDGIVAVVPCWFAPGQGEGRRFITPINCPPETPRVSPPLSQPATRNVDLVVRAARRLPGVKPDRVAVFGHSRGGGAAWNYVLQGGKAQAVILDSAGYTDELIRRATGLNAPILILHGEKDSPEDGGGPMTKVSRARAFERALRRAGRPVEAVYYPRGRHNSFFASASQHADEVQRIRAFLRRYLGRN